MGKGERRKVGKWEVIGEWEKGRSKSRKEGWQVRGNWLEGNEERGSGRRIGKREVSVTRKEGQTRQKEGLQEGLCGYWFVGKEERGNRRVGRLQGIG